MSPDTLAVFARAPRPGVVKTRLARERGAESACAAYTELLCHTLSVGAALDVDRALYLPPGDTLPAGDTPLLALASRFTTRRQRGLDLGARMANAFEELFAEGRSRVVLIGSDCPYVTKSHLRDAFVQLRETKTVFGPAVDGGYWLVGQRAPGRDLFSDVPWSTPTVWDVTLARLEWGGWSFSTLETLEDVDDGASWDRYRARKTRNRRGTSRVPATTSGGARDA